MRQCFVRAEPEVASVAALQRPPALWPLTCQHVVCMHPRKPLRSVHHIRVQPLRPLTWGLLLRRLLRTMR